LSFCSSADNRAGVDSEHRKNTYPIEKYPIANPLKRDFLTREVVRFFPILRSVKNFRTVSVVRSVSSDVRTLIGADKKAALERAEVYYAEHPGSPSAVRRPKLSVRSGTWIALLGRSVQGGIAGFGPTVERALRAFDAQYLNALRPPSRLDRAA
jgi:hypothetical protein